MKILYFFLFLWVIFALLDPDPATQINADPDPQRCIFRDLFIYLLATSHLPLLIDTVAESDWSSAVVKCKLH
jgi:hypothetical protein